jgi:hypothetical protein
MDILEFVVGLTGFYGGCLVYLYVLELKNWYDL